MKFSIPKMSQVRESATAWFRRLTVSTVPIGTGVDSSSLVPRSSQDAHARLRHLLDQSARLKELSHDEFMRGWLAVFHIAPALNADEAATDDGGWPVNWAVLATEALRRFEANEMTQEELHPKLS